jgi:predicted amidohydrolase
MTNLYASEQDLAVALMQTEALDCRSNADVSANVDSLCAGVQWAARAYPGIDLVVFPESSTQGAPPQKDPRLYLDIPSPLIQRLLDACAAEGVWALFNVLERREGPDSKPFNSTILVNAKGKIVLTQHKINPFVPTEDSWPGSEICVCPGPKGAVFGVMTCYDGDFPEVARDLAAQGANVLLRPSSYMEPYSEPWSFVNRARAYENLAYVIAVNRFGITHKYNWFGGSMAVDYLGRILAQAPLGVRWTTKVDIDPRLADRARAEFKTHNHLHNLKHRGYAGRGPDGDQSNVYGVYRNWK